MRTEGDLVLNRRKAHLGVFALSSQMPESSVPTTPCSEKRSLGNMEYFEKVFQTPSPANRATH